MAHSAQRRRRPAGVTRSAYFRAFPKQETCQLIRLCQTNPLAAELALVQREVTRLTGRLARAEAIIDLQKKVTELLGIPLAPSDGEP